MLGTSPTIGSSRSTGRRMPAGARWWRRLGVPVLALGVLLGGGAAAVADPPPGWEPGANGIRYDFGGVAWRHHGWYEGAQGNWHTGLVEVEEDDDGITGVLIDWSCPGSVVPPGEFYNIGPTRCTIKRLVGLTSDGIPTTGLDLATFDQATKRLEIHRYVDEIDQLGAVVKRIRVDLVIAGKGTPEVEFDDYGDFMYFHEIWSQYNAWGQVDGRRVKGPGTEYLSGRAGYWLDGWVRTT